MQRKITLEFSGNKIPADKFKAGVDAFFSFLSEVAKDYTGKRKPFNFQVHVRPGSAILENEVDEDEKGFVQGFFNIIEDGVKTLEAKSERPKHFTNPALEFCYDLAKLEPLNKNGFNGINIWIDNRKYKFTHFTAANINALLGISTTAFGSIDGKLTTLSIRGEDHFYISERLDGESIRCLIQDDTLMKSALENFGNMVRVFGLIKYGKNKEPYSINVEEINPVFQKKERTTLWEIRGLIRSSK